MLPQMLLLAALAVADSNVTISAVCGGGTPESFGVGALARDSDGAVFRIEPGALVPARKVAINVSFVGGLRDRLEQAGFERIQRDAGNGPWCGITRTVDSSSHSVRWATRVESNGSLAHLFESMPVDVWHVFLELQNVAVEQELCGHSRGRVLTPQVLQGAVWMSCTTTGLIPVSAAVYVLGDGDVVTSANNCSRIAGSDLQSLPRWHALLNEADFDKLSDHPGSSRYGNTNCSVGRWLRAQPHVVGLQGINLLGRRKVPNDPQWKTVERVFVELGAKFAPDDARLTPAMRRAMNY